MSKSIPSILNKNPREIDRFCGRKFDLTVKKFESIFEKIDSERINPVDLLKRSTLIKSILSIFIKKKYGSDSIFFTIESIFWSQKMIDSIKKLMIKFPTLIIVPVGSVGNLIFWSFDLLSLIFDLSIFDLLIFLIFKKDRRWSNRSRRSFKKINSDQIDYVNLLKIDREWMDPIDL